MSAIKFPLPILTDDLETVAFAEPTPAWKVLVCVREAGQLKACWYTIRDERELYQKTGLPEETKFRFNENLIDKDGKFCGTFSTRFWTSFEVASKAAPDINRPWATYRYLLAQVEGCFEDDHLSIYMCEIENKMDPDLEEAAEVYAEYRRIVKRSNWHRMKASDSPEATTGYNWTLQTVIDITNDGESRMYREARCSSPVVEYMAGKISVVRIPSEAFFSYIWFAARRTRLSFKGHDFDGTHVEPEFDDIEKRLGLKFTETQRATYTTMLRQELGETPSMQSEVFEKIGEVGGYEIFDDFRFGAYPNIAIRETRFSNDDLRGGLVVAPCGWGKTALGVAITARNTSLKTLVVCPKAVMAQWRHTFVRAGVSVDMIHSKQAAMKAAKASQRATVTIMSMRQLSLFAPDSDWDLKTYVWDRVIFDECHALPLMKDYTMHIQARFRWGLTATVPEVQYAIAEALCQYQNPYGRFTNFPLERIRIVVKETPVVSCDLTETRVTLPYPQDVKDRCDDMTKLLKQTRGWGPESLAVQAVLRKIRAGNLSVKPPLACGKRSVAQVYSDQSDECPVCLDQFIEPLVIPCGHVFCTACIRDVVSKKCPCCRASFLTKALMPYDLATATNDAEASTSRVPVFHPYRVAKALDIICNSEADDVFVVFSHYGIVLDNMEHQLKDADVAYTRFHCTSFEQSLDAFEKNDVKVMLLNVRITNAGLNLTKANKLIFLEEPPSDIVRTQALGRVVRRGQTRDVCVYTFISNM